MFNKPKFYALIITMALMMMLTSGCNDNKGDCCTIIDTAVTIAYKTAAGENLINSTDEMDESNIRVYYKNGEEFEYIYKENLDHPNMHYIYEDQDGGQVFVVFPSDIYDGIYSTTLIELNENISDTLRCEFELESNRTVCINSWLNGVEMTNRFVEIRK